ncbi:MAG TPA: flagellar biosynthetic protein FliR [Alphaproteobacteria bacterium]
MFAEFLSQNVFGLLLVFTRVGAAMVAMPGVGETTVPARYRLLLAAALTVLVLPGLAGKLPALPDSAVGLFLMLAVEIVIGLFLGGIGRILLGALYTAGSIISLQASLSNAFVMDTAANQQGSLPGVLLSTLGVLLLLLTDLHHMMIRAIFDSYGLFTPGQMPPIEDLTEVVSRLVSQSFLIGIQLSAPLIAVGLIMYLGVGLLARLMPQMQVFFIIQPAQVAIGLIVVSLTIPPMMLWFLNDYRESFARALGVGW